MEAAIEFAVSGETMDFMLGRIRTRHLTPPALFTEIYSRKMSTDKPPFSKHQRSFKDSNQCIQHDRKNNFS